MSEYKYTADGQKVEVVGLIRKDVWEVRRIYEYDPEYREEDMDGEEITEDHSSLHHGPLYDYPTLPVQHGRIAELEASIKELEQREDAMQARVDALRKAEREFENNDSHIQSLGNLKRLMSQPPTHFVIPPNMYSLPRIVEAKEVRSAHDGIAKLVAVPGKDERWQLTWRISLSWSDSGNIEAWPCHSHGEAVERFRQYAVSHSKADDLGTNYMEWKKAMEGFGLQPSAAATAKHNAKMEQENERKRKELEDNIKRQSEQLKQLSQNQ